MSGIILICLLFVPCMWPLRRYKQMIKFWWSNVIHLNYFNKREKEALQDSCETCYKVSFGAGQNKKTGSRTGESMLGFSLLDTRMDRIRIEYVRGLSGLDTCRKGTVKLCWIWSCQTEDRGKPHRRFNMYWSRTCRCNIDIGCYV